MPEAHGEVVGHHATEAASHGAEVAHGAASSFEAGFSMPGFIELGTMIGFLCLFL